MLHLIKLIETPITLAHAAVASVHAVTIELVMLHALDASQLDVVSFSLECSFSSLQSSF
jgi:hypothetical protein